LRLLRWPWEDSMIVIWDMGVVNVWVESVLYDPRLLTMW